MALCSRGDSIHIQISACWAIARQRDTVMTWIACQSAPLERRSRAEWGIGQSCQRRARGGDGETASGNRLFGIGKRHMKPMEDDEATGGSAKATAGGVKSLMES